VNNTNIYRGFAMAIAVAGNYAYIANGGDGLRIYNVSNPTNPVTVGHAAISNIPGAYSVGVTVSGNYAYLANSRDGLRIYDVSSPTNPVSLGSTDFLALSPCAMSVALAGPYACVADYNLGFGIFNTINNTTNGGARFPFRTGSFIYMANHADGIRLISIPQFTGL
jgi:hypothetical protein